MSRTSDEIRQELEKQLSLHERAHLKIRSKLNGLLPVNRLPPELLALIFRFCRDNIEDSLAEARSEGPSDFKLAGQRWISFTWVCRHWRRVAMNEARLWNVINIDHWLYRKLYLSRSRNAPLYVTAPFFHGPQSPILEDVLAHFVRIMTLHVEIVGYVPPDRLFPLPPITSPLRSFIARSHDNTSNFPAIFKNCTFDDLTEFELVNCVVEIPTCFLVRTLTRLVLAAARKDIEPHTDISALMGPISHMECLQTLVIKRMRFTTSDRSRIPSLPPVHLPQLCELELDSPGNMYPYYVGIIDSLKIPPTTRTRMVFQDTDTDTDTAIQSNLSLVFPSIVSLFNTKTVRSLLLTEEDHLAAFEMSAWPEVIDFGTTDYVKSQPCTFVRLPSIVLESHHSWHSLVGSLDVRNVEVFCSKAMYSIPVNSRQREWTSLFGRFDRLNTLRLVGNSGYYVHDMLRANRSETNTIVTPLLQHIYLSKMSWHLPNLRGRFIPLLEHTLTKHTKDCTLQQLTIETCRDASRQDISLLEMVVQSLEWDGRGEDNPPLDAEFDSDRYLSDDEEYEPESVDGDILGDDHWDMQE